jgi:glycyl-tRNA synthetase beta subunit
VEINLPGSLLLEAGFPGLPSNIFGQKLPNIKKLVSDVIEQEKFSCSRTRFWLTNHRLGILIEAIADTQSDSIKEVRGPKVSAAYDLNNIPTPAATGFATAQGLALKDLLVKEVDGEKFLFAKRKTQGQSLAHCLPKIAEKIFKAVFAEVPGWFEKSLFPQPLLNLCAMLNDQILDLEIDQVKAGSEVINLKRFQQKNFPLDNALLYPEVMQKLGIMNERVYDQGFFESHSAGKYFS